MQLEIDPAYLEDVTRQILELTPPYPMPNGLHWYYLPTMTPRWATELAGRVLRTFPLEHVPEDTAHFAQLFPSLWRFTQRTRHGTILMMGAPHLMALEPELDSAFIPMRWNGHIVKGQHTYQFPVLQAGTRFKRLKIK